MANDQRISYKNALKDKPTTFLSVADGFNFTAQSGNSLVIGSNTITFPAALFSPYTLAQVFGIGNYLYISGGVGTAEKVIITAVGTITVSVTCANTHTGAWTIQSASAGIQECIYAAAGTRKVLIPFGVYTTYAPIILTGTTSNYVMGEINDQVGGSTKILNGHTGNTIVYVGDGSSKTIHIKDLLVTGTASAADGISITNSQNVHISHCWVINHGGNNIYFTLCYQGQIINTMVYGATTVGKAGVYIYKCNNIRISGGIANGNYNGISVSGGTLVDSCVSVKVSEMDIESNTNIGIALAYCTKPIISHCHLESNSVYQWWTDANVTALNLIGNYSLGNQPSISASSGVIIGNTFQGGSTGIVFLCANRADFVISGNTYVGTPAVGYGTTKCKENIDHYDSAAPTLGAWIVGDIVYNTVPTAGGFIGWVCTVAGSPGTWKTFGAISA